MSRSAPDLAAIPRLPGSLLDKDDIARIRRWAGRAFALWTIVPLVLCVVLLVDARLRWVAVMAVPISAYFVMRVVLRYRRLRALGVGSPTTILEGPYVLERSKRQVTTMGGELVAGVVAIGVKSTDRARAVPLEVLDWFVDRQSWLIVEWLVDPPESLASRHDA